MGHVKRAISIKQKSVFQANEHLLEVIVQPMSVELLQVGDDC